MPTTHHTLVTALAPRALAALWATPPWRPLPPAACASTGPVRPLGPSRRQLGLAVGAGLATWLLPRNAQATPAPLLAREWPVEADPAGFLVSEKLDGVRALWDGQRLRFRSGGLIHAPAWFTDRLPPRPLDGELWAGHGAFESLVGTVRRQQPQDAAWQRVQYQVFELPGAGGRFAERAQALADLCRQTAWAPLQALPQQPVADRAALQRLLAAVLGNGGEGLVLHRADAPEASGRGPWLYKHKPLHDAEATVVAHLPGQGRLAGQLGALQVRSDAGQVFAVGTGLREADRAAPPPIGQRITYTHRGLTAQGLPRFASYLRPAVPL